MGFLDKFKTAEQKLLKFLATNKTVIEAVIRYMGVAYTAYSGEQKMQEAIKFLLIFCKVSNVTDAETAEITKEIENGVQSVYNELKAKNIV